jgi:hypothetical protein
MSESNGPSQNQNHNRGNGGMMKLVVKIFDYILWGFCLGLGVFIFEVVQGLLK